MLMQSVLLLNIKKPHKSATQECLMLRQSWAKKNITAINSNAVHQSFEAKKF
jgi:hypothetical protein